MVAYFLRSCRPPDHWRLSGESFAPERDSCFSARAWECSWSASFANVSAPRNSRLQLCRCGVILSWLLALAISSGSYLLFWPLLFGLLGNAAANVGNKSPTHHHNTWIRNVPAVAAAILLFAPVIYLVYIFLTLQMISAVASALLLGLFFLISLPTLESSVYRIPGLGIGTSCSRRGRLSRLWRCSFRLQSGASSARQHCLQSQRRRQYRSLDQLRSEDLTIGRASFSAQISRRRILCQTTLPDLLGR